jgi:hypothetical protein
LGNELTSLSSIIRREKIKKKEVVGREKKFYGRASIIGLIYHKLIARAV